MKHKLVTLILAGLSVWLASPAQAADGDSCSFVTTTVAQGTTTGKDIPLPGTVCGDFQGAAGTVGTGCSNTRAAPQISCRLLCDKTIAGAFSCGPMWVPGGGANVDLAIVRVISGPSPGCGYDDVNVYTLSNIDTTGGLPSLGTLDDDGSGGGGKQIEHFGPLGPYIYLNGTADDAGALTCDPTHRLQIQLLLYPKYQH